MSFKVMGWLLWGTFVTMFFTLAIAYGLGVAIALYAILAVFSFLAFGSARVMHHLNAKKREAALPKRQYKHIKGVGWIEWVTDLAQLENATYDKAKVKKLEFELLRQGDELVDPRSWRRQGEAVALKDTEPSSHEQPCPCEACYTIRLQQEVAKKRALEQEARELMATDSKGTTLKDLLARLDKEEVGAGAYYSEGGVVQEGRKMTYAEYKKNRVAQVKRVAEYEQSYRTRKRLGEYSRYGYR